MSLFVDRLLMQFSDPAQLTEFLESLDAPSHEPLLTLLGAMYELPYATIHDVRTLEVNRTELQRPLFPPKRIRGNWTQTIPNHTRTDVMYEDLEESEPIWLDATVEMQVTLTLEIDAGEVEAILTQQIDEFSTLDEFRAHFRFFDLETFMAEHAISTVADLRERYHYLLTEIRLRAPKPFNPDDPANQYRYPLNLAILIRDVIDVAETLRDVKLAQKALQRAMTYRQGFNEAEVRTPYAPLVIFPEDALASLPFEADDLRPLFATEGILVWFITPS